MPTSAVHRFPKDFSSTLMTVACVEAVLLADGSVSPYAWEKANYGAKDRGYGSGPKTRGSMARNRSGQVVVSPGRLAQWEMGRAGVTEIAKSPIWPMLRRLERWPEEQWLAIEPASRLVLHIHAPLFGAYRRRPIDITLLPRLAACGTFDAVAALWTLLLEVQSEGRAELAFECARYLVVAISLLGATQVGSRVALPILARIRQLSLDRMRCAGQMLSLADYDLPTRCATASKLPVLGMAREQWSKSMIDVPWPIDQQRQIGRHLIVPEERLEWVGSQLPPTRRATRAPLRQKWSSLLSPMRHPGGPCHPKAFPVFHSLALARLSKTLKWFA